MDINKHIMPNREVLILSIILLVGFLFMWSRCSLSCKNSEVEQYKRSSLSEDGPMKRSPVNTAFRGDGMSANPHYQANPGDKLVPLEYGGVDLYQDERKLIAGQSHATLGECYQSRGEGTHLVNDSRTRADMIDSGEMGWHRTLNNMTNSGHARSDVAHYFESDFATAGPMDYNQGLYHPSFHNDHVGN